MPRSIHSSLSGLAIFAVLSMAVIANAAGTQRDADLPPIDPPGKWHLMTQDPTTTESQCVGDTKTAMCLVETILACFERLDDNLCRISLDQNTPLGIRLARRGSPRSILKYRVESVKKFRYRGTYDKRPDGKPRFYTYTTLDIAVEKFMCWDSDQECVPEGPNTYSVIKLPTGHWQLLGWDKS